MAICVCEWVFVSRVVCRALASMPGDVLLFQRLSVSTIGAVRFHGRVRDGIGWVTDAMVTKQWSKRGHAHEVGFNRCPCVLYDAQMMMSGCVSIVPHR